MNKLTIEGTARNASVYKLDDGRIFRVHLNLITPVDNIASASFLEIETNGYQISLDGSLVLDGNGEPITISRQRARIPMGSIRDGRDTVHPRWREIEGDPGDAPEFQDLPESSEPGDRAVLNGKLYVFDEGIYERIRRQRVSETGPALPPPLDQEAVASLIP